jgi:hypothetical protein
MLQRNALLVAVIFNAVIHVAPLQAETSHA